MRVEYGRKNAFDVEVRVGVKKGIIMGIIVISCVLVKSWGLIVNRMVSTTFPSKRDIIVI